MYAERLKEIRKHLHYTVKEIADILKIKERTYGSYERKENNVSIELVTALCKYLNINANWFCTGQGSMFNAPQETSMPADDKILKLVEDLIEEKFKQKGL